MQQKPPLKLVNIFVAYVNEDEPYLHRIEIILQALKGQNYKISWEKSKITAGMDWKKEERDRLNQANLILLLVSWDFLASEHSKGRPVEHAIKRHQAEEAWVIPIITRQCIWNKTKFAKLQPLPKEGKPIEDPNWPSPDHAYTDIAEGIIDAVDHLLKKSKLSQSPEPPSQPGNITQFPKKLS